MTINYSLGDIANAGFFFNSKSLQLQRPVRSAHFFKKDDPELWEFFDREYQKFVDSFEVALIWFEYLDKGSDAQFHEGLRNFVAN